MSTTKKNKHSKKPKSEDALASLVAALDDAPIDAADAREAVTKLGIDVKTMATSIRERIASASPSASSASVSRAERIEQARLAYAKELEELERRKNEPLRTRDEQMAVFHALLAKAPPQAVAMHFHKYETATDDELAEMIRSLRHLVGADEPE